MPRPHSREAQAKHRIPVIDRMMEVLGLLEAMADGASMQDLVASLDMPRTTIYRIVNTLQLHGMIRRNPAGKFELGPRLLGLASHVSRTPRDKDLVLAAQPHMDRLSAELGESCKLSVLDGDSVLVVATSQGRRDYALTALVGQILPMHAGAAGKQLMAHLPTARLEAELGKEREAFTEHTVTDREALSAQLREIARKGWSEDQGEGIVGINAYAAPILDKTGAVAGALSVPFLASTSRHHHEVIRKAVIRAANEISAAMPDSQYEGAGAP